MVFTQRSDAKANKILFVISGFRRVADNCALQGYYAASSVICYHYWLRDNPEQRSSQDLFLSNYTPARLPPLVIRSWLR
jgi:hypothetical protein